MNEVRKHSRGYTLVELLVVLAIIAIIASISIPLLARTTFLENSALQNGSRELYAYLRAAKIYAVDHRVDTAVIYGLESLDDTINGGKTLVATGLFLGRGLTAKERRALGLTETQARNRFIRIGDTEGQYHALPDGTCVLNLADWSAPDERETGITLVRAFNTDDPSTPIQAVVSVTDPPDLTFFPAHIFTPSGIMDSSRLAATQRVELMVAPTPNSDPEDRIADYVNGQPVPRYIGVEIKPSLGRVKITS